MYILTYYKTNICLLVKLTKLFNLYVDPKALGEVAIGKGEVAIAIYILWGLPFFRMVSTNVLPIGNESLGDKKKQTCEVSERSCKNWESASAFNEILRNVKDLRGWLVHLRRGYFSWFAIVCTKCI